MNDAFPIEALKGRHVSAQGNALGEAGLTYCAPSGLLAMASIVATILFSTVLLAAEPPPVPGLEQALTEAMERNPEVVAAKAEVALAEAKLNSARLEVARKIVALRAELEAFRATADLANRNLDRMQALHRTNQVSTAEVEAARQSLIDTQAKLSKTEAELRFLIGQAPSGSREVHSSLAPTPARQEVRGPMAETILKALNSPVQIDFMDSPVSDVVTYLSEFNSQSVAVPIRIDSQYAKSSEPITISLKDLRLAEVLQAIEDQATDLQFVVREYGILATSRSRAKAQGYVSAVEFWQTSPHAKEAAPLPKAAEKPPAAKSVPAEKPAPVRMPARRVQPSEPAKINAAEKLPTTPAPTK